MLKGRGENPSFLLSSEVERNEGNFSFPSERRYQKVYSFIFYTNAMSATDFTRKGLNQMIFAKKTVLASNGRNSSAFKSILADKNISHVINKPGEKKVFYDALKKRGMSSEKGITRNVLKKVLGDVEHSGQFSHHEMMDLRKHLVGGPISSSITREYGKLSHAEKNRQDNPTALSRPHADMRSIYQEIMDKSPHRKNIENNQTINVAKSVENKVLNFRSNSNIRSAESLIVKPVENRHHIYDPHHISEDEDESKALLLKKLHDIQS